MAAVEVAVDLVEVVADEVDAVVGLAVTAHQSAETVVGKPGTYLPTWSLLLLTSQESPLGICRATGVH